MEILWISYDGPVIFKTLLDKFYQNVNWANCSRRGQTLQDGENHQTNKHFIEQRMEQNRYKDMTDWDIIFL